MRAVVFALVLCTAAAAHAAPWSFNLPAGYTEIPGGSDAHVEKLRAVPGTVSADAQVYTSADGAVKLTRVTWLLKLDGPASRAELENMDRNTAKGSSKRATKHISESRSFNGDQLVAEQVDEVQNIRVHQRRIYAVDTSQVAHVLTVGCAGPADQLAECVKAQQSMVLMLPNQASLDVVVTKPDDGKKREFLLGQIAGGVIVLVLVAWYVARRRKQR
jgi:hypothetical protein